MVMLIEVTPPHPMPGWLDGWLDDPPPPGGGGYHPAIHQSTQVGRGGGVPLPTPQHPAPPTSHSLLIPKQGVDDDDG